ncbi:MAG TPA: hypothetical protein VK797_22825 [Tepidisphaeraceae bacterium]|jgi:hypothetical protein|nr:hypothetical protein [Tepidisphaeraceae bacterium]
MNPPTAAILCPGTSLSATSPIGFGADVIVIAVNRASAFFPADVWAAGDYPLIEAERAHVRGMPELLTTEGAIEHLRQTDKPWPWRVLPSFESLDPHCQGAGGVPQWRVFTAIAACVYAEFIGCKRIEVFGADWQGEADFDGVKAGGNRSPERWRLERNIFENLLTPWLNARGVSLFRHHG